MESVLIIRITYLDTDCILIPGVNVVFGTLVVRRPIALKKKPPLFKCAVNVLKHKMLTFKLVLLRQRSPTNI